MKPRVDELEAIIRKKICTVCDDRTVDGTCGIDTSDSCALFQLFPYVAQAILATDSDTVEDYRRAIEENVCSVCLDQRLDGSCPKRGQTCALDTYLAPILEAIQEATGKVLERPRT